MSNYFIYVGFVAAFILLFILGTRIASIRAARNRRELYNASQAGQRFGANGLPMPVTSGHGWLPAGLRNAGELYGGIGTSGVAVARVDGAAEGDHQLPSYGAPSIPVPESVYSPTTARYLPPHGAPLSAQTSGAGVLAPPEYKYAEPSVSGAGAGVVGSTPPKYEGGGRT